MRDCSLFRRLLLPEYTVAGRYLEGFLQLQEVGYCTVSFCKDNSVRAYLDTILETLVTKYSCRTFSRMSSVISFRNRPSFLALIYDIVLLQLTEYIPYFMANSHKRSWTVSNRQSLWTMWHLKI